MDFPRFHFALIPQKNGGIKVQISIWLVLYFLLSGDKVQFCFQLHNQYTNIFVSTIASPIHSYSYFNTLFFFVTIDFSCIKKQKKQTSKMGNFLRGPNIDAAYDILMQSTNILPDSICCSLIQSRHPALFVMVRREVEDYWMFNDTSIGNLLAIMRAFPDDVECQKNCERKLREWLNYMFLEHDVSSFYSEEIRRALSAL